MEVVAGAEMPYLLSDLKTAGSCWTTRMSIKRGGMYVYVCVCALQLRARPDRSESGITPGAQHGEQQSMLLLR